MKSKFLKKAGAALLSATMLTNTAAFSTFISDAADSTETRLTMQKLPAALTTSLRATLIQQLLKLRSRPQECMSFLSAMQQLTAKRSRTSM